MARIPNDTAAVSGSLIVQYVNRPAKVWQSPSIRVYPEGHWTLFFNPASRHPLNQPRLQNLRLSIPYRHKSEEADTLWQPRTVATGAVGRLVIPEGSPAKRSPRRAIGPRLEAHDTRPL
jgi:hypothetical protein